MCLNFFLKLIDRNIRQYLSMFSDFKRVKILNSNTLIKKLNSINTVQSILYDTCIEISLF